MLTCSKETVDIDKKLVFISGVLKGDRVAIYMPMTFDIIVAMLACVRIGAVHSIVVCRPILIVRSLHLRT